MTGEQAIDRLCELNVIEQAANLLCRIESASDAMISGVVPR